MLYDDHLCHKETPLLPNTEVLKKPYRELKSLKNKKAAGDDGIFNELPKQFTEKILLLAYKDLLNKQDKFLV